MSAYKIILSGGGTGGHIYPAIAIANALKARFPKSEFLFVGAKDKMEMQKVPQAGYSIIGLWISGIQRRLTFKNVLFPVKLVMSLFRSMAILNSFKPDVVIGTGGFASGPLLQVAAMKGVPTLIQEQNSFPGITNKLLSKKVTKVCVAYEGLERFFPKEKLILTGNPVRQDVVDLEGKSAEASTFFGLDPHKKTLLVLGGSLGARRINQLVESKLDYLKKLDIQLIWQCGKLYEEDYSRYNSNANVQVHTFLNRMDLAYASADVIISRAGASSVSELCVVGKPVIFIPSPNVSEDHQTKNASAVSGKGAALLIREQDLESNFESQFSALISSESTQLELSAAIKQLALKNATQSIVDEIEKLLHK
ncbi:MAG: undecaprenyldiphospho-muramoylpentapeptide beta-N-acetylglucosaminyltransferase [Flavobacteriaceae bacterium]|jgi:UDP-N-acetylglucosamine--N-acetylmuramyl-(pentapeptide) pyrophosphoryl-undecaprenol N-acetylglucosamine transferase|nr:undecaprenyldiphospho-muramoylpentapeptide beta-N-acetylglucosaminyltransferase [Flavobacteriaceae bacterium]MDG1042317.1 undecaprenyldiphospho-muramoylpentapeptide beta-N-acetylglucosaminyltransferase [Flavobacteriaceae bacterium]